MEWNLQRSMVNVRCRFRKCDFLTSFLVDSGDDACRMLSRSFFLLKLLPPTWYCRTGLKCPCNGTCSDPLVLRHGPTERRRAEGGCLSLERGDDWLGRAADKAKQRWEQGGFEILVGDAGLPNRARRMGVTVVDGRKHEDVVIQSVGGKPLASFHALSSIPVTLPITSEPLVAPHMN